jgi:hypothetical protein
MTQFGYWRNLREENRRAILQDYGTINKVWYLFPQGGGPRGSFETFTALKPNLRSRDLIYLSGVLREQATTPLGVFDVTVLGAANKPRQATSGGVPAGGGASWLAPTSPVAATPLISVIEQGWEFNNIQMAPVAAAPCIWLRRQESATIPDASHCRIISCYFSTGGAAGMGIALGETSRNRIEDCDFDALDGGGDGTGIGHKADGGFATNAMNHIIGNRFHAGTNFDIQFPGTHALIENNIFEGIFVTEGGFRIDLDGGALNMVINNYVKDIDTTIALGFRKGSAADVWRNFVATVVDPKVVVPA